MVFKVSSDSALAYDLNERTSSVINEWTSETVHEDGESDWQRNISKMLNEVSSFENKYEKFL